jgi:hypothetical protein
LVERSRNQRLGYIYCWESPYQSIRYLTAAP